MDERPRRKRSLRWHGFNYASVGSYAVTVCVQDRLLLFGHVDQGVMHPNAAGRMVERVWAEIPREFPFVQLGAHVVMPNHVHGILRFVPPALGAGVCDARLGDVIRWWKAKTTTLYAQRVRAGDWAPFAVRLWQRGFYDRVLRDDAEAAHAAGYIIRNPRMWDRDPDNPMRLY